LVLFSLWWYEFELGFSNPLERSMSLHRLRLASFMLSMMGTGLQGSIPLYEEPRPFDFHAYAGFRQDQFDFNIQHDNGHVNGHDNGHGNGHGNGHNNRHQRHHRSRNEAQVKWKSLNIAQVGAILDYSTYNHYCFKASADYGKICSGRADVNTRFHFQTLEPRKERSRHEERRSRRQLRHARRDYKEFKKNLYAFEVHTKGKHDEELFDTHDFEERNHRDHHKHQPRYRHHVEESEQTASASHGNVADLSAAIGYKFISDSRRTWVSGLLGWSGHAQDLHLSGAEQKEDSLSVIGVGPLHDLSGSLNARWQGPWVGFDFLTLVDYNVTVYGSGEWHWASYQANGDWKYGQAYCASIRQRARGYGVKGTLGVDWNFCADWTLGIIGDFQRWSTRSGSNRNKVRYNTLPSDRIAYVFPIMEKSALHRVIWISFSVSAQIAYRF
jgi:hypothetical protein